MNIKPKSIVKQVVFKINMAREGLHSGNIQSKELPKAKINASSLKRAAQILNYIAPYKGMFVMGMLFLMLSSISSLFVPYLFGKLIGSGVMGASKQNFELLDQFFNASNATAALVITLIVMAISSFSRVSLMVRMGESALGDLRKDIYSRIIRLPMEYFTSNRVGEIQSRIAGDTTQIQEVLTSTLAEFVSQVIVLIGGVAFLLTISGKLTLLMLGIFPILIAAAIVFGRFIRKYARKSQDKFAETNTIVEETMQAISSVKAYTNEWFEVGRYKKKMAEVVDLARVGGMYRGGFAGFMILAFFGSIVAVVWYGAQLEATGEIGKDALVSFILYSVFVGGAMGGFADFYTKIQKAVGATERVFELLNEEVEPVNVEKQDIKNKIFGEISFKNVHFAYPSRKELPVLNGLNINIAQGQKIAVVGTSGGGKSTITNLLLRFYNVDSGSIEIDGKNINDYDLTELRKQIAIVPQDVVLFGGTIFENISYGLPSCSKEMVIEAAKKANAHEFIERIPEGYDTIVGERGIKLSGGQRQRIAIARALLKNPAILLLDEATSSLDSESEKLVQAALDVLMEGRTSLIIAHRLSTIRNADVIAVLNNGVFAEQGTHEELILKSGGIYQNLKKLEGESL